MDLHVLGVVCIIFLVGRVAAEVEDIHSWRR